MTRWGETTERVARLRQLTPRQYEVACLAGHGYTNKAIGERLCVSDQTVKNHMYLAMEAMGVQSRAEIAYVIGFVDGYNEGKVGARARLRIQHARKAA